MFSTSAGEGRPVRRPLRFSPKKSTAFFILSRALRTTGRSDMSPPWPARGGGAPSGRSIGNRPRVHEGEDGTRRRASAPRGDRLGRRQLADEAVEVGVG